MIGAPRIDWQQLGDETFSTTSELANAPYRAQRFPGDSRAARPVFVKERVE